MGYLTLTSEVPPSAPSTGVEIYSDSNDNGRVKAIHSNGIVDFLTPNNRFNYLINGGMDFVQRFTPALTTNTQSVAGRQLNADQWGLTSFVPSCQYGRIDSLTTPISGSVTRYYGQYKQITSAGKIAITQCLEFKDIAALRGKTVRIQIKIATGAWGSGSALRLGMIQNNSAATQDVVAASFMSAAGANGTDPTLGTNLAYVAPIAGSMESSAVTQPTIVGNAVQIPNPGASLGFTRYSALFTVPSTAVNIFVALWTDSQLSINDVLNIAEGGLYLGQEVADWNPLSYNQERERCLRHYQKTFSQDTAPIQNAGLATGEFKYAAPITTTGTQRSPSIMLEYGMRIPIVSAQVTFFAPNAVSAQAADETAGICTSTTFVAGSDRNFAITAVGNAATAVGNIIGVHFAVDQAI